MKRILAAAVFATTLFPFAVVADEAESDGVVWLYEVENGEADILSARAAEVTDDDSAKPESAVFDDAASPFATLEIPGELGGCRVVSIGDDAFAGIDEICEVSIPDGVQRIGSRAFKDCRGVNVVRLPDSVVEIGERAFSGCRMLAHVNLGPNITNIALRTFRDCRSLASIDLPDNIASIGEKAFADCSSLHAVTIPKGVTNIAASAFADCSSLSMVVFLGPEPKLGEGVFDRVNPSCFFRASSAEGWSVDIPGVWQGRKIVDLAIDTYRRRILIFLPMVVGAIGTIAILVLAIVLRERRGEGEGDEDYGEI